MKKIQTKRIQSLLTKFGKMEKKLISSLQSSKVAKTAFVFLGRLI
jgi:hypothetical protein